MSRRAAVIFLAGCLACLPAPRPAASHPHVWILVVVTFVFDGERLTGVRHRWTFDDLFSAYLSKEFNRNSNDRLEPEEQESLRTNAFANLAQFGYFSHLRLNGQPVELAQAMEFTAALEDGSVVYEFSLPLPTPATPHDTTIEFSVYDASYFVDVILDENDAVRFAGIASGACQFAVRDDPARTYYFNLIVPQTIRVACQAG